MSVLIKGMETPRGCDECYIREKDTCPLLKVNVGEWGRRLNCPIVELPDHGDLIDRDELMKHGVYMPREGGNLPLVYMSYVKGAKAVIPAERSEE